MSQPLFSIIIPTYNHAALIGRCLDGLIAQTYANWEAIVVNNFSRDNTIEVVNSYNDNRIKLINNANDGIIAVSRNKGIENAQGQWICFLDSDDWWTPNKLEDCLPYLENYDLIYHDMLLYYQATGKTGKKLKGEQITDFSIGALLASQNHIINSSVVIRKSIADQVGKITEDRSLIAVEDFDYWIRVLQYTNRAKYVNKVLGYYFIGENTSTSLKQIDRLNALYNKYRSNLTPSQQKLAEVKFNYDFARLFHKHKQYKDARKCYLEVIKLHPFNTKAIIGIAAASVNICI